ncbi:MAG TPA: TIGR04219 family outer membrane beta-barrel protein [Epsilonproteobacteria bacterium]|nr:TIGR04219 family outer membrane beta-barrel protein [Campylobacterota bacterium]
MKKIFFGIASAAMLATTTCADLLRAEIGLGAWIGTSSGEVIGEKYGFQGVDTSSEKSKTNVYGWAMMKHFIPVVPNLRVEYLTVTSTGEARGTLSGVSIPGSTPTKLEMKQFDVIPYYNVLDNTAWITLDLGIDFKIFDATYTVDGFADSNGYRTTETFVLPLGYVRGRIEVPGTNFGAEADVKYIEYGNNTAYDMRAKVDYTFDITPVIQPAIEVGYRMQKYQTDKTSDISIDLDFSGVYAGVMLRF